MVLTRTSRNSWYTWRKRAGSFIAAPCTSLVAEEGLYETFNFENVVWNRGAGTSDDAECVVRSYGPGAWPQGLADG